MSILNQAEIVALQALGNTSCEQLPKAKAAEAKSELPEAESKTIKLTAEIEATVSKGKPPAERPNTSSLGSDADLRILAAAVEEVREAAKRDDNGRFRDSQEASRVLDMLMDVIVSKKSEWSERQIECGNDPKKRKQLKKDFLLETGNPEVLMRFAQLNKELKANMPKVQPAAPVRVTFENVKIMNCELLRDQVNAEKGEA
tara:strand:- start:27 stop:629 length:603 start_codon:yes stop_codon:yes gene_type:complete